MSVARSGSEAYALACELRPDAVVFDVELDELTGTLFYARLRRNPKTRRMPALVHSEVRPRYGTGIATLRKSCAPALLAQTLRKALTPREAATA